MKKDDVAKKMTDNKKFGLGYKSSGKEYSFPIRKEFEGHPQVKESHAKWLAKRNGKRALNPSHKSIDNMVMEGRNEQENN